MTVRSVTFSIARMDVKVMSQSAVDGCVTVCVTPLLLWVDAQLHVSVTVQQLHNVIWAICRT